MTEEEKHKMEMEAMQQLVKDLPGPVAKEIYTALERFEKNSYDKAMLVN